MYIDPNNIPASEGTLYVPQDQNLQQPVQENLEAPMAAEGEYYQAEPVQAQPEYQQEYQPEYQAAAPAVAAPKSNIWKGVLIGGVPGIALGAAGVFAVGTLSAATPGDGDQPEGDAPIYETAPVSEAVNDDMSFSEAFNAAREDVGAGGVFVWHGQIYSTYTSEEWAALTPEQQAEYVQSLANAGVIESTGGAESEGLEGEESGLDTDPNAGDEPGEGENNNDGEDHNAGPGEPEPNDVIGGEEPGQVDVLGSEVQVEEVGYYENEDGSQGIAAVGTVDGHNAVFVDVDADGVVDSVMVDADGDGVISENEVQDLSDSGLTVDDLSAQIDSGVTDPTDDIYAGGADYTNDADTSSLS